MKSDMKNLWTAIGGGAAKLGIFIGVCTVVILGLALTNSFTAPIISSNQEALANQALLEVMEEGQGFAELSLEDYVLPATVTEVYKETSGLGYVFKLVTSGYGSDMTIMCGVSADGVVTGATCIFSNETLGYEKTYGANFKQKDMAGVEEVATVSSATFTTGAYKKAIVDALNATTILGGGFADIRTEEEILADNLAAALPQGEGSFERLFLVEAIENVDAVYVAANGAGYVFVCGELFVGVLSDGTVVTEGVENAQALSDGVALLKATVLEEIDLSAYPTLAKTTLSAQKTASGNFVMETKGAGYGIKGGNEYHPASGEYIVVRVAMTIDGKILDCITVYENESDGIGDACAKESFYGQFVGKTSETYTEIETISGATMTTDGYKQAIQRAFDALKVLTGGNENEQ